MTATKKCEYCDKRGLPLLLVRDAVAPAQAGAPLAPSLPIELPASAAHYTKRLLRTGYLNVYDEARKRWEAYFVTPDGYFFKLLQTPGVTPVVPAKPFNCPDEGHRAIASCITVPDPKNATKVWLGFSDALWTDDVRKTHEDVVYRKRHMVEIDVKAALAGGKVPHAGPIAQVSAVVAEYAMDAKKGKAAFVWDPAQFNPRHGQAEMLVQECESMRPGKGLIVTLPDPAGIAQGLAFLMKHKIDMFSDQPESKRRLAASTAIANIENAVRVQAELGEIAAAEQMANEQISQNPIGYWLSEPTRKRTEDLRDVTPAELQLASDESWKKYAKKFDGKTRQTWQADFNKKLEAYDKQYVAPLALSHVAWMKSSILSTYFECNYDRRNVEVGVVYTNMVNMCITATQDKGACSKLYDEWLNGDVADTKNLLLQAMLLNHKPITDAVKGATTVSIDLRQIPWDNVFGAYSNSVARLSKNAQDAAARLVVQIAGPVARMLGKVMDGAYGFRGAIMALGLISGHPVVVCEVTGNKKLMRALLIRKLFEASGQVVSENRMKSAVNAELRRQQIRGAPMEGTTKTHWVVLADTKDIRNMPPGLKPTQRAEWLASHIKTPQAVQELNLGRWRTVISEDVKFGIVAGILQAASLTKLIADEEKSLVNENADARRRLYAGITAVAATTAEVFGNVLANGAVLGGRFGQGIAVPAGAALKIVGKSLGVVAGIAVAAFDVMKLFDAASEKQTGLAWLYGFSAILGAGVTLSIAFATLLGAAAIPIIGILVLLLVGIGILIEYIKDNPVQDWLERCPWGILPAQRYQDLATEQAQLAQALK